MTDLLLALLLTMAPSGGEPTTITARHVSWDELQAVYPREWILPQAYWASSDAAQRAKCLPLALDELLSKRFDSDPKAPRWSATFGDFVAEARRRGAGAAVLDPLLAELKKSNEPAHAAFGKLARELLLDRALHTKSWKGDRDLEDDGLYVGELLERRKLASAPWNSQRGADSIHQVAALVFADLEAIESALGDYPAMLVDPGTSYDWIEPDANSFVVGDEPDRGPFCALRIRFRSELPFPFSHYDCDLGILDLLDAKKRLTTFVFTPSDDFYWFAGEDFHYPVVSSDGAWQATLVIRICGFDLKGVPDGDSDRVGGTRTVLGNLKRRAELGYAKYGGPPRTTSGAIPRFAVIVPPERKR